MLTRWTKTTMTVRSISVIELTFVLVNVKKVSGKQ
jgi:hypothetical protein